MTTNTELMISLSDEIPEPVARADAASRLTIAAINSIGTDHPGTTLPLLPDPAGNRAILNADNRLVMCQNGLFLESMNSQFGCQTEFSPVSVEYVFSFFYNSRSTLYVCHERHLDTQNPTVCFQGNFTRVVLEDYPATVQPEGSLVPVVGLGQLRSLPVFDSAGLVEWCTCDNLGNVFALKGFRLGSCCNYDLMPFKPTHPGIGRLKPVTGRTPEVILDTDPLFVLANQANLTFINLCNGLTGMDWKVLKGHTTGIVSHENNGLADWQRRERLLAILANAASQGVTPGIVMAKARPDDGKVTLEWNPHADFIDKCKLMGMAIPAALTPATMLLERKSPSKQPPFPFPHTNGSTVAFDVQPNLPASLALARIVRAASVSRCMWWTVILLIIPDDLVYPARRALSDDANVKLVTAEKVTSVELFNRAVHEAKADVVLMFGFKINTNASYIQRILQWGAERPVPIGCIYFGDNNNLNADDYYLYDTVFNVSTPPKNAKAGLVQFLRKHPDNSAKLCLDANGKTVDEARPPADTPKTAEPTLSELYADLMF